MSDDATWRALYLDALARLGVADAARGAQANEIAKWAKRALDAEKELRAVRAENEKLIGMVMSRPDAAGDGT